MTTKFWKLALIISLLSLAACAGNTTLEGTAWQLVSIAGNPPVGGTQPTIAFEDGQAYGNSSCNSYSAEYKLKDDTITFGVVTATEMACLDPKAMNQEQALFTFLSSAERWELRDGQLFLFNAVGDALVFETQN